MKTSTTGKGFGDDKIVPSDNGESFYSIILCIPMVFETVGNKTTGGFEVLSATEQETFKDLALKVVTESCKVNGFILSDCLSYFTEWELFNESFLNIRLVSALKEQDLKTFGIGCLECFLSLLDKVTPKGTYYCPTFHCMTQEQTDAFGIAIPFKDEQLQQGRRAAVCTLILVSDGNLK